MYIKNSLPTKYLSPSSDEALRKFFRGRGQKRNNQLSSREKIKRVAYQLTGKLSSRVEGKVNHASLSASQKYAMGWEQRMLK